MCNLRSLTFALIYIIFEGSCNLMLYHFALAKSFCLEEAYTEDAG